MLKSTTEGASEAGPAGRRIQGETPANGVECYSGHTYAQEPRAVLWQGQRYPVIRVQARWRTPDGPAFVVAGDQPGSQEALKGGQLPAPAPARFELHYQELEGRWTVRALPADDLTPQESLGEDEKLCSKTC